MNSFVDFQVLKIPKAFKLQLEEQRWVGRRGTDFEFSVCQCCLRTRVGTLSAWSLSWTPVPTCILLSEPKQVRVKRILPVQLRGRKKAQKSGIQPTAHLHRHYSFIDDLF